MEEYLNTLLEQLRCKKAREIVREEICNHINDQAQEYRKQGNTEETALQLAVREMGDPIEIGISLDRIHRPQIAWSVIGLVALISLISIAIHIAIGYGNTELGIGYVKRSITYTSLGFIVMLLVYRLDYSFMAKHGKMAAFVFLAFEFVSIYFIPLKYNGARAFVRIGGISISLIFAMLLFIPIYAALLYQYRGSGYRGMVKAMLWMIPPVLMTLTIPCLSIAIFMFIMMTILLTIAIVKNWFSVNKKLVLFLIWGGIIFAPPIWMLLAIKFHWLAEYQSLRLQILLGMKSIPESYDYLGQLLKEYSESSRILGGSGKEIVGYLPDYYSSYILAFLGNNYGTIISVLICALLLIISLKIFRISLCQKNQLGMIMGCGCGLVFFGSILLNILENVGWFLATQTFLPFISYGGTGVMVSYILLGIVLSIYRYKTILPISPKITRNYKFKIVIEKQDTLG